MNFARAFPAFIGFCLAFGFVYRLAPLVMGPEALSQFFITEDGYLMLTVARNFAIGNGLSVSDGTIATNGVQPLATFLYAIPYWLTGGDKLASLVGIVLLMTLFSAMALWAIKRFAGAVLAPLEAGPIWAWVAAALWFLGPLMLFHSMNALETGLYIFAVTVTVTWFGNVAARGLRYTRAEQITLGLLSGFVFLARNDGAFLVVAIFAARFVSVWLGGRLTFREAVAEAIPPGILSLVIAAPWLIYNKVFFGSIVPISGQSEAMGAGLGQNLPAMPAKLFETMLPMLPVPNGIERDGLVMAVALAVLLPVLGWFLWQVTRRRHVLAVAIWAYVLYAVLIVGYYGLFFGAGHFLARYLAPLAPLFLTAAIWVLLDIGKRLPTFRGADPARIAAGGALVLSLALLVRLALPGVSDQGHFQVVDWVEENVAPETWVGAVQTGTLGYWHDRTINLDGKVNPEALLARQTEGDVLDYVGRSEIDYVADWAGMAGWIDRGNEEFTRAFEVVVVDPDRNLAVLRRRDTAAGS